MGSIYKLRPEIKEFIIAEKKKDPYLSCRSISLSVKKSFNVDISKSSVHSILKAAGMRGPESSDSVPILNKEELVPPVLTVPTTDNLPSSVEASAELEAPAQQGLFPLAQQPEVRQAHAESQNEPVEPPDAQPRESTVLPPAEEPAAVQETPLAEEFLSPEEPSSAPEPAADADQPQPEPAGAPETPLEHIPFTLELETPAVRDETIESPSAVPEVLPPEPPEPPANEQPDASETASTEVAPPAVEPSPPLPPVEPVIAPQELPLEPDIESAPATPEPQLPPAIPAATESAVSLGPVPEPVPAAREGAGLVSSVNEPAVPPLEDYKAPAFSGVLLLKAIDFILGGIAAFTEAARMRSRGFDPHLREKLEALLCVAVLRANGPLTDADIEQVRAFVGKKITREFIAQAMQDFQAMPSVHADILNLIPSRVKDVRCLRGTLADGQIFSLDGQLHTIWSSLNIPYDFASTVWRIEDHLAAVSSKSAPCIMGMAPGYDMPSKEFFSMFAGCEGRENPLEKCALYGNQFEEMEIIPFPKSAKIPVIFGIWPWQFTACRKVHSIGEFKPLAPGAVPKELGTFEVAEIGLDLTQPNLNKSIALRGAALKLGATGKIRLLILTNQPVDSASPEHLARLYLRKWPNLEEGFQDYSRKIELFTYRGSVAPRIISPDSVRDYKESMSDILGLLGYYARMLDVYMRWHFLPFEIADKSTLCTKDVLSGLKASVVWMDSDVSLTYQIPPSTPFSADLPAAFRRLNEFDIRLFGGRQVWFSAASS